MRFPGDIFHVCGPHLKHQNELNGLKKILDLGLVRWSPGYGRYIGPLITLIRDTSSLVCLKTYIGGYPKKKTPSHHETFYVVNGKPTLMAYLPRPTS